MRSLYRSIGIIGYLLTMLVVLIMPSYASAEELTTETEIVPEIRAEAAILIDAHTGVILFAKNENERLYPASITKIVTGIIALEQSVSTDIVTVSKEARHEDGTRVYLAEGEQKPMQDLIEGMLINSGNDAATAIAEYLDGTKLEFAVRMNMFVESLGLVNTNFVNPSGLHDPEQYTTASDMATIARYAMENESFREIVSTKTKPWVGLEWNSELSNHNKMLGNYEGSTGIKNGYTNAAGFTLVSSAKRGNSEFIGVVLKGSTDKEIYKDMTALLDYGFEHYDSAMLLDENEHKTYLTSDTGESMEFYATEPVWMTIRKGEELPAVEVNSAGQISIQSSSTYSSAETVAQLMRVEPAGDVRIASEAAEAPVTESISMWPFAIMAVWLMMIVFMLMCARLIIRKRRRGSL